MMNHYRKQIVQALKDRGFTGEIQLYYWHNDGWYCDCNELCHTWIGQHKRHAIEQINKGIFDNYLNKR